MHLMQKLTKGLTNQKHLKAIRQGFLLNLPLIVVGAFAIMLGALPTFMPFLNADVFAYFGMLGVAALKGMNLTVIGGISYCLAEANGNRRIHPLLAALVSLTAFFVLMPSWNLQELSDLPSSWTGADGLWLGVFTAIVATEATLYFTALGGRRFSWLADVGDPLLSQILSNMVPATVTILIFYGIHLLAAWSGLFDVQAFIYASLSKWLSSLEHAELTMVLFSFLVHVFWFFGMHGSRMMNPALDYLQSLEIVQASGATVLVEPSAFLRYFEVFVLMGGAGMTLSLMAALVLVSRRGAMSWLIKLSFIPAVFNINELLVFGLPIVLNPTFLLPFLAVPLVATGLTVGALYLGVLPAEAPAVSWTMPVFFSGYVVSGSWTGVFLQALNLCIGALLYLPFVKWNENQKKEEMKSAFQGLQQRVFRNAAPDARLLERGDEQGTLARSLAHDLKESLKKKELFLLYQPQVNADGNVVAVEALLRWNHAVYGAVAPPVIIAIAEEARLIHGLGQWIIQEACAEWKRWQGIGIFGVRMSVNVSPRQLQAASLSERVRTILQRNEMPPQDLEIEITETAAITSDVNTEKNLEALRNMGVRLAIDDFGMGHTSLRYIRSFPMDTLKIDGMLSRDVLQDKSSQEIVWSITSLCASLGIETIVEYVETEEQRQLLQSLGCRVYQGYLYSPPLAGQGAAAYVLKCNFKRLLPQGSEEGAAQ
ncbi:EAL domain-containing protein [uncultured Anaeromusa sp.]|uniref:EAL domain-containing protein n=1 Tax=uncultured Anaeromusa sp. TaxID=673273 RepID=UPI0029C9586F|nr:EAL domain-containing protein [uncultured Anaeromusa sp.]